MKNYQIEGKTQPVKLLNDYPYDEFEYILRDKNDLIEEILKKCCCKLNRHNYLILNGALDLIHNHESVHDVATMICDELNVERRGHRHLIEQRINDFEYAK